MLVRGIEEHVLPTCKKYGMGVIPWSPLAGGWLTGAYRKGQPQPSSNRARMMPNRFDITAPENQAKLDAADALAKVAEDAGMTLINMAIAFVIAHPAVTSAIIGPRTMEQWKGQADAGDIVLSNDVLDAIDAIVPPGRTITDSDSGWTPTSLQRPWERRRPVSA
jgi:aryl-alcohol dehydrogenase-like predicted oxidoreductase